ncbi:hypothetical protein CC2G_004234 [Coprinopsis cinerea AmutBmut pab1-1]|nr:hypothetical protein CC2G_004234 [Coprinopsis cinerea AmutBmut pab1-1]
MTLVAVLPASHGKKRIHCALRRALSTSVAILSRVFHSYPEMFSQTSGSATRTPTDCNVTAPLCSGSLLTFWDSRLVISMSIQFNCFYFPYVETGLDLQPPPCAPCATLCRCEFQRSAPLGFAMLPFQV